MRIRIDGLLFRASRFVKFLRQINEANVCWFLILTNKIFTKEHSGGSAVLYIAVFPGYKNDTEIYLPNISSYRELGVLKGY